MAWCGQRTTVTWKWQIIDEHRYASWKCPILKHLARSKHDDSTKCHSIHLAPLSDFVCAAPIKGGRRKKQLDGDFAYFSQINFLTLVQRAAFPVGKGDIGKGAHFHIDKLRTVLKWHFSWKNAVNIQLKLCCNVKLQWFVGTTEKKLQIAISFAKSSLVLLNGSH